MEEDVFISKVPIEKDDFVDDTLNDTLNDNQKKILDIIREHQHIKQKAIAELLNVTVVTVKREMQKLIKLNKIQREGSKKTGSWIVKR